jgi:hypothetical protein
VCLVLVCMTHFSLHPDVTQKRMKGSGTGVILNSRVLDCVDRP